MYFYIRIIRQIFIKLHVCSWPHQLAPISILPAAWFIGKGEKIWMKYHWLMGHSYELWLWSRNQSVPFPRCMRCLLGFAHNNLHCLLQKNCGSNRYFLNSFTGVLLEFYPFMTSEYFPHQKMYVILYKFYCM